MRYMFLRICCRSCIAEPFPDKPLPSEDIFRFEHAAAIVEGKLCPERPLPCKADSCPRKPLPLYGKFFVELVAALARQTFPGQAAAFERHILLRVCRCLCRAYSFRISHSFCSVDSSPDTPLPLYDLVWDSPRELQGIRFFR